MKKKRNYRKYKFYSKRKGIKKHLGIYALTRTEAVKAEENRPGRKRKSTISHGILKGLLLLEIIKNTQWALGDKIQKKTQNPNIINNYLMAIRKQHGLYNMHYLMLNLRHLLHNLASRMLYKKQCLINYSQNDKLEKEAKGEKPIETFPRRQLMVTWKKWLGGVLTNFKRIAKRLISKLKNKTHNLETKQYTVSYPRNLPRLPSFVICTSDCHWALNETKAMRIKNLQMVETSYNGGYGYITLAMNTNYHALRSFTALIQECASSMRQTAKFFHRRKLIRYLRKKSKRRSLTKFFLRMHNRILKRSKKKSVALKLST